jgi:hypothetical protein
VSKPDGLHAREVADARLAQIDQILIPALVPSGDAQ